LFEKSSATLIMIRLFLSQGWPIPAGSATKKRYAANGSNSAPATSGRRLTGFFLFVFIRIAGKR
jgi:hypothetical protein